MNTDARAFEYVLGTLSESERRDFQHAMEQDATLAAAVRYWEEQLMAMQNPRAEKAPHADVWKRIEQRISQSSSGRQEATGASWLRWWPWAAACVALLAVLALPLGLLTDDAPTVPNSDYVAVLTDEQGRPQLTAMTLAGGETLWLQWENISLSADTSAQLWAVSRRDGQIRPLAVFNQTDLRQLPLNQARRRLIADAEYLLLTEEELGGSPLDEPSSRRLARGVCVRLIAEESS